MGKSIVITKRVSFVNLIDQVEKLAKGFGDSVSVKVSVDYWRHSHIIDKPTFTYTASFICNNKIDRFESENPLNLIEQIEAHLNNVPMDIIDVNI